MIMEFLCEIYGMDICLSEFFENVVTSVHNSIFAQYILGLHGLFILLLWQDMNPFGCFGRNCNGKGIFKKCYHMMKNNVFNKLKRTESFTTNDGDDICVYVCKSKNNLPPSKNNTSPQKSKSVFFTKMVNYLLQKVDSDTFCLPRKEMKESKNQEEDFLKEEVSNEEATNESENNHPFKMDNIEITKIINNQEENNSDKQDTDFSSILNDEWCAEDILVEDVGNNFQLSEFIEPKESYSRFFPRVKNYTIGNNFPEEENISPLSLNPLCITLLESFEHHKETFCKNMKAVSLVIDAKHDGEFSNLTEKYREALQCLNKNYNICKNKLAERREKLIQNSSNSPKKLDLLFKSLKDNLENEFLTLQSNFVDNYNKGVENCKTLKTHSQLTLTFYRKKFYDNLARMYRKLCYQNSNDNSDLFNEYSRLEISRKNELKIWKNHIKTKLDQACPDLQLEYKDMLEKLNNCYQDQLIDLQKLSNLK